MEDWKNIKKENISSIAKVVAHFEVWSISTFPFGKVKIKILENTPGNYTGVPNMAAKNNNR